ncbi:hypothetical protein ACQCP0_24935 [Ralstonia pseudosolanacearum]
MDEVFEMEIPSIFLVRFIISPDDVRPFVSENANPRFDIPNVDIAPNATCCWAAASAAIGQKLKTSEIILLKYDSAPEKSSSKRFERRLGSLANGSLYALTITTSRTR